MESMIPVVVWSGSIDSGDSNRKLEKLLRVKQRVVDEIRHNFYKEIGLDAIRNEFSITKETEG